MSLIFNTRINDRFSIFHVRTYTIEYDFRFFSHFIKGYCVQIGVKVSKADGIIYHGLLLTKQMHLFQVALKSVFKFWDEMTGAFITHVGSHVMTGCNPKGQRISQATAEGHTSSVKVYFTNKFWT